MMFFGVYLGGDFFWLKKDKPLTHIQKSLNVKSFVLNWRRDGLIDNFVNILELRVMHSGESFKDQRGVWNRKNFSSLEEENAYLKAQVEYLKKHNPNLHGKEWS
jgi:hypothetical protein